MSVGDQFCNSLVQHIAEGYGSKVAGIHGLMLLGNECYEGVVEILGELGLSEHLLYHLNNFSTHYAPGGMVEGCREAVRAWCFITAYAINSLLDLLWC